MMTPAAVETVRIAAKAWAAAAVREYISQTLVERNVAIGPAEEAEAAFEAALSALAVPANGGPLGRELKRERREVVQPQDLPWTDKEKHVIANMMEERQLSGMALLRAALRQYQVVCERLKAGETCTWSGDEQRAREFSGDAYAERRAVQVAAEREVERLREELAQIRHFAIGCASSSIHRASDFRAIANTAEQAIRSRAGGDGRKE